MKNIKGLISGPGLTGTTNQSMAARAKELTGRKVLW